MKNIKSNLTRLISAAGAVGLCCVCGAAGAQSAKTAYSEVGHSTINWLELQASGREAGPVRPMLGAEASAGYARYLDSFNHPIPEFFNSSLKTSGGSGAGTN